MSGANNASADAVVNSFAFEGGVKSWPSFIEKTVCPSSVVAEMPQCACEASAEPRMLLICCVSAAELPASSAGAGAGVGVGAATGGVAGGCDHAAGGNNLAGTKKRVKLFCGRNHIATRAYDQTPNTI